MAETFICALCGREHPIEGRTVFDGKSLCPTCLEEHTCVCDRCGDRIWVSDSHSDGSTTVCNDCFDRHYDTCAGCGRIFPYDDLYYSDDDSDGYCAECYQRRQEERGGVQSYYYKPDPIFYGSGPRFLGVELEIDDGGESDRNANDLMRTGNRDHDHIYIKHDGSLDDGLEIVTHPMSLDYHRTQMPWREIVDRAKALHYTSHKAGTCGLHVHVNRSSLGRTCRQQDDTIARILFFVENHWNELLRFSRRTPAQMDRWAARYGRKDDPKSVLDCAKRSGKGRYTCVNLDNDNTIEFRMFRGTLKYNTLIATLQLVNQICDVAFLLPDEIMQDLTWSLFVSGLSEEDTPELIQYLKEQRLYVSDPVEASEEV